MPSTTFDRDVLKVVVAQVCHSLGWNSMQKSSLGVLTDILERYIKKLSKVTASYCQNSMRTDVNLDDLELAFNQLGVQVCELEDYVHQVEAIHFPKTVPKIHSEAKSALQFPLEEEILSREEWYDIHLPTLGKEILKNEDEIKAEEEPDDIQQQMPMEADAQTCDVAAPPPAALPKKRPADSPPFSPIEPKRPAIEPQLFLPNLVRPDVSSFPATDGNPMLSKEPFIPFQSPALLRDSASETSIKKVLEEKNPFSYWEKKSPKDQLRRETTSPDYAKRMKLASPSHPNQSAKTHHQPKDGKSKKDHTMPMTDTSQTPSFKSELNDSMFSPAADSRHPKEPLTSPLNKFPSNSKSPLSERLQTGNSKGINSPFLPSPINQPVPKPDVVTSASEKKSKKAKKAKKSKGKDLSAGKSKKLKSHAPTSFSSSPQLFASPHILKSPPEPRSVIVAHASVKASPKPEQKIDHIISPSQSGNEKMPDSRSKPSFSTPVADSPATPSNENKSKKIKKKALVEKTKKKEKTLKSKPVSGKKKKSPMFERQETAASLTFKKIAADDDFKSPSSKSPAMLSPRFSVAVSHAGGLSSPEYRIPEAKLEGSKQDSGKGTPKSVEERKKKKDKKSKKNEDIKKKKSTESAKVKKNDTPSLKLTFKRAPSGAYQEQSQKESSTVMKVHGMSPAFSPTIQTPSPKVTSPPPEPISKKIAKVKTPVERPAQKEKKLEPAVRIEPLVINDAFMAPDEKEEPFEREKKTGQKQGSASKKEGSGKKGRPSKKGDSGKKPTEAPKKTAAKKVESPKKAETARRPSTSKTSEVYQPDQYFSSPPSNPAVGEQSVSRGLFIQTITEPTTTQVWYCPSCLRPDDGSPMIGCDSCDGWYHWICVGINEAPSEDVEWYCGTCVERLSKKKAKKRKKKD